LQRPLSGGQGVFLLENPMDVLKQHPVRKTKQQKLKFREAVQSYCRKLGYDVQIEKGSFGVQNVVIGDPRCARYVVTAHYDTCAVLPFPNLITPCNFWLFLGWQLLLVLILCVPVGLIGGLIGHILDNPDASVLIAYVLLLLELFWMLFGPANLNNANDNTSGVIAVLTLLQIIPKEKRHQVCFVLFDLEEAGLFGSSAYRNKHRRETNQQVILNLDCVGEGDEILLFPTKKVKQDRVFMDRLQALCCSQDGKSLQLQRSGFSIYPSDQVNFPKGVGIAAFCRSKWAGLYLAKIHTPKDTCFDEKNIAVLCDFLKNIITE